MGFGESGLNLLSLIENKKWKKKLQKKF